MSQDADSEEEEKKRQKRQKEGNVRDKVKIPKRKERFIMQYIILIIKIIKVYLFFFC